MTTFFGRAELYRIAMEMEKNGLAYYVAVADQAPDRDTRAVYEYLASAEKRHLRTFKRLWTRTRKSPPGTYRGEYGGYLKTLLKDTVFASSASDRNRASRSSVAAALRTGIKAEKDSILFYSELIGIVSPDDRDSLQRILNEEKRHLSRLTEYQSQSRCLTQRAIRAKGDSNNEIM
jgi:rubrerythrin